MLKPHNPTAALTDALLCVLVHGWDGALSERAAWASELANPVTLHIDEQVRDPQGTVQGRARAVQRYMGGRPSLPRKRHLRLPLDLVLAHAGACVPLTMLLVGYTWVQGF